MVYIIVEDRENGKREVVEAKVGFSFDENNSFVCIENMGFEVSNKGIFETKEEAEKNLYSSTDIVIKKKYGLSVFYR